MAEGFEPPNELPRCRFSSRASYRNARLIRFTEALRKQGWTVTDKHGLLDKSDE